MAERQKDLYQWGASSGNVIKKITPTDCSHLVEAWWQLHCRPYLQFIEQHNLYTSYNLARYGTQDQME